jgi:hypothetical protein
VNNDQANGRHAEHNDCDLDLERRPDDGACVVPRRVGRLGKLQNVQQSEARSKDDEAAQTKHAESHEPLLPRHV